MISFNKIVNKVLKKRGKVLFKNDIFEIIDPEFKKEFETILNKTIYNLKSKNIIIPLRNGVYIVPEEGDLDMREIDLIEKYYYKLLKKYISHYCMNNYFISQKKALEFHLKDFGVNDKIYIVNRTINKKVKIGDYTIIFKTISYTDNKKKINAYNKLSNMVCNIEYDNIVFKTSNLELALVENALITDNQEGVDLYLLNKTIKKYSKFFNHKNFKYLGELKYIMAFNRLKELSKNIDKDLYRVFLDIIKKNGGAFIGEGLRKI